MCLLIIEAISFNRLWTVIEENKINKKQIDKQQK